jgi:hypothetical protein
MVLAMLRRRLIAVITGLLFLFSSLGHGFAMAGMTSGEGAGMVAAAADMMMPMASDDGSKDCSDRTDCKAHGMDMACFAHCVSVTGILPEPAVLPMVGAIRELTAIATPPLASLHGPPDPHPPRSIVLI